MCILAQSDVSPTVLLYLQLRTQPGREKKAAGADSSGLQVTAPHSGQPSQLVVGANDRHAQFRPTVSTTDPILTIFFEGSAYIFNRQGRSWGRALSGVAADGSMIFST